MILLPVSCDNIFCINFSIYIIQIIIDTKFIMTSFNEILEGETPQQRKKRLNKRKSSPDIRDRDVILLNLLQINKLLYYI